MKCAGGAGSFRRSVAALYAPTGGIVCPFELNLALAENAFENGAEFYFDTAVEQIEKTEGGYRIHAEEKYTRPGVWSMRRVSMRMSFTIW